MHSTWETRDLPVLRAAVQIEDETFQYVKCEQIEEATGLDDGQVQRAIAALAREEPRFFDVIDASSMGGTFYMGVVNCTGHARRRVGAWPTAEGLTDRIIAALADTAENAPSEEERGKARKVLDAAGGVGKGVLTSVLTKVLTEGL